MIGEGKTRGQPAILDVKVDHNQNSAAIRVSEAGYPPEYLFWFLVSEYERTRNIGSGNNQPALNKSRVENMLFPFAPLPEQVRIVASLERAMSVTSSLKQVLSVCSTRAARLRQAILKKAFEGKLVPQDPNDEPASALLERIRTARGRTPAASAIAPALPRFRKGPYCWSGLVKIPSCAFRRRTIRAACTEPGAGADAREPSRTQRQCPLLTAAGRPA